MLQGRGVQSFSSPEILKEFAEEAVRKLESTTPSLLSNFMLRVDIMQRSDGRLVVNEFESLEAAFSGKDAHELQTQSFLADFWLKELNKLVLV
jgi:hypothetical protein